MPHELGKWTVENKKVSFALDKNHTLSVKKTEKGITIRVLEHRGNKDILLYTKYINDDQLGLPLGDNS